MIYVDREGILPTTELDEASGHLLESLNNFQGGDSLRKRTDLKMWHQRGVDMAQKELWRLDAVAFQLLKELFQNKCAYCESRLSSRGIIDRFRPKNFASDGMGRKSSFEHYWWLSADWRNLYLVCERCNSSKGNRFPVKGSRGEVGSSWDRMQEVEDPLLLDPCVDNPEDHLRIRADGWADRLTQRGEKTIEILDLNRKGLVAGRKKIFRKALELSDVILSDDTRENRRHEFLDIFSGMIRSGAEYVLAARCGFLDSAIWENALGKNIEIVKNYLSGIHLEFPTAKDVHRTASVHGRDVHVSSSRESYLERIEIKNFRAIHELSIPENPDESIERWLVLIGENGSGKSTILKAISLIFADDKMREKIVPEPAKLINRNSRAKTASIKAWFSHDPENPVELVISKGKGKSDPGSFEMMGEIPDMPLLAYGSTRLPAEKTPEKAQEPNLVKVENLFNPWVALGRADDFFADTNKVNSSEFNQLAGSILKLLDMGAEEEGEELTMQSALTRRSGELFLKISGSSPVPLSEQSDGYQAVVTLVSDIMRNLSVRVKDMENASGLVLIDEIGCHLHPSWRIRIVETMRLVFPNVRFIISTHEPLCLRGTHENEVYRVYREEGEVTASVLNIPPGLSADQLLTGAWFGLTTTLDHDTLELMEQHRKMLVKGVSERAVQRRELEDQLRRRLSPAQYADTSMDRMVRSIAAEEIEKENVPQGKLDEKSRSKLRDRVLARLKKGK